MGNATTIRSIPNNFIGEKILAKELIDGEVTTLKELQPDIIMVSGPWHGIQNDREEDFGNILSSLPLTTEKFLDLIADIPEHVPIVSHLPLDIEKALLYDILLALSKKDTPSSGNTNILWAASKAGWKGKLINLFDLLKADLTIVNDIPIIMSMCNFLQPSRSCGALFSQPIEGESLEDGIKNVFTG